MQSTENLAFVSHILYCCCSFCSPHLLFSAILLTRGADPARGPVELPRSTTRLSLHDAVRGLNLFSFFVLTAVLTLTRKMLAFNFNLLCSCHCNSSRFSGSWHNSIITLNGMGEGNFWFPSSSSLTSLLFE